MDTSQQVAVNPRDKAVSVVPWPRREVANSSWQVFQGQVRCRRCQSNGGHFSGHGLHWEVDTASNAGSLKFKKRPLRCIRFRQLAASFG